MIMSKLIVEKIYDDVALPVKAHSRDSGFDLFAYRFLKHYTSHPQHSNRIVEFDGNDGRRLDQLTLFPNERVMIGTGIRAKIDIGGTAWEAFASNYDIVFELQVRPRSGTALKRGLIVTNTPGTVDSGYEGEICVIISNISSLPQTVELNERIAQLVPVPVLLPKLVEGKVIGGDSRGDGGFNSTGT